jgi:hypothetical protein
MARKKRSAKKRAKRESRVKRSRVAKRTARREKRNARGQFTKRKGRKGHSRKKRSAKRRTTVIGSTKGMVCVPTRKKRKSRKGASRAARCSAAGRGLAIHKYHPRKVGRRAASLDARILERCKKLGDQLSAVLDGR